MTQLIQGKAEKEKKGKLIVLEGLDGSGKSVQHRQLLTFLTQAGYKLASVDFPNYDGSYHGGLIGRYLRGEFGDIYEVEPHFSSWLYAGDRLEAKPQLLNWLNEDFIVVANRYVGANLAYHSAKLPPEERPGFIQWLKAIEYEANGLPREDLVIYLHAPVTLAQKMIDRKAPRSYTTEQRDIHERNTHYLEEVHQQYLTLCQSEPNWVSLEVADVTSGEYLSPELIHSSVAHILREYKLVA